MPTRQQDVGGPVSAPLGFWGEFRSPVGSDDKMANNLSELARHKSTRKARHTPKGQ